MRQNLAVRSTTHHRNFCRINALDQCYKTASSKSAKLARPHIFGVKTPQCGFVQWKMRKMVSRRPKKRVQRHTHAKIISVESDHAFLSRATDSRCGNCRAQWQAPTFRRSAARQACTGGCPIPGTCLHCAAALAYRCRRSSFRARLGRSTDHLHQRSTPHSALSRCLPRAPGIAALGFESS